MRCEDSRIWKVSHEQKRCGDELHRSTKDDHGQTMTCVVDEGSAQNLGNDRNSLNSERVRVDGGLGEARLVVLEPEEEHALEGEGFEHGADDGESCEDVSAHALA